MKKVAFLTTGDPINRKGMFNNVQERAWRLSNSPDRDFEVDFFMIRKRDSRLFSLIRRQKRPVKESRLIIGEINYENLWVRHDFFDYLLSTRLKKRGLGDQKNIKRLFHNFSAYDLILAHGPDANYLAYEVNKIKKTPYIASWHGTDINITPFKNQKAFGLFKKIIESATINFFVSKKLLYKSNKITLQGRKEVFYTGPSDRFYPYKTEKIDELKKTHKVGNKKIIGFIGNLVTVKNIKSLPLIFQKIADYDKATLFWIIGNGALESKLIKQLEAININFKMFGKLPPEEVPKFLNCMDILLLPSLNEGLPRVALEAYASRIPVLGSNRGGIPEVIGNKNAFDLNNNFIDKISERAIEILKTKEKPNSLPEKFSWEKASKRLIVICRMAMDQN